ncbi:MAG: hypothetical protein ACYDC7_10125 [Acidithiobacillus ferrivorans]
MRLSPEQINQIRQSAAESFGPEARVWLFGSRVDDSKLGGDVDLLVESDLYGCLHGGDDHCASRRPA